MYPKWMTRLLLYFNLWGLSTHFHKSHRNRYHLIFAIHFGAAAISTFVVQQFFQRPNYDQLGTFNDILKTNGVLFVYWISILELNSKQQTQRKFWNIVQKIDNEFRDQQHLQFRVYITKMIIYFTIFVLMFANYFIKLFQSN